MTMYALIPYWSAAPSLPLLIGRGYETGCAWIPPAISYICPCFFNVFIFWKESLNIKTRLIMLPLPRVHVWRFNHLRDVPANHRRNILTKWRKFTAYIVPQIVLSSVISTPLTKLAAISFSTHLCESIIRETIPKFLGDSSRGSWASYFYDV